MIYRVFFNLILFHLISICCAHSKSICDNNGMKRTSNLNCAKQNLQDDEKSLETLQSTPSYLWKYTNIHNVKSLNRKEDAREYITNLAVIWNITEIKDGNYFLNNLTQAIGNNAQVACDHLFTNKSDETTNYILMFVRTISSNHIEVGFSQQKTQALDKHNNGLELFNKTLTEYRQNALQNLHLHINIIQNFHDGSLSDQTPFTNNRPENIYHIMTIIINDYLIWFELGLCLIAMIIGYVYRQPIKNLLTPLSQSIEKRPTYPINEKESQDDSSNECCQTTHSCSSEDEKKLS